MKIRKKNIVFYGVSGHGKCLVDPMSAFGCKKIPLKSMVICENFQFDSSLDIFNGLREKFIEKENRHYYHTPLEDLLTFLLVTHVLTCTSEQGKLVGSSEELPVPSVSLYEGSDDDEENVESCGSDDDEFDDR